MVKTLLRLALAILLVILVFVAAVIANNLFFDEALDPKAAAVGEPVVQRVAEAQNGYLALIALGASDGADSFAYARAWLNEARAAAKENRAVSTIPVKRAKRPELCDADKVSCLAVVRENESSVVARLDSYKEDIARYERLLEYRAYEEVLDYPGHWDSQLPAYSNVSGAQRAYLLRAALALHGGRVEEAVAAVERDIVFQRVRLAGARTITGKLVAAAQYRRDLAFVADMLQLRAADLKLFMPRLTEMLKPIDVAVLGMGRPLETLFVEAKQQLKNPTVADTLAPDSVYHKIGARFFYKPNATINEVYRLHLRNVELSRRPPALLLSSEPQPATPSEALGLWDFIDNPVGKIALRRQGTLSVPYALSLHDLDGYNRLVALGAEILAAEMPVEAIGDFVAKADTRFYDPYSGKPMAWDAGARQLSFKPSNEMAKRKPFNMENGRVILRM